MRSRMPTAVIAGLLALGLAPQEVGYAPKMALPDRLPDDPAAEVGVLAVRNAVVPPASAVGVPAYPGARIYSTVGSSDAATGGGEVEMLPALALLTTDEIETVAAFFTDKLTDWSHEDFFGNHMFWNGPEGSSPLDISGQFPLVGLVAIEPSDPQALLWPDVKTRIDIRYVPGGK